MGGTVVLTKFRWRHIVRSHPELRATPEVLRNTVAMPDDRVPGRLENEEWYYRRPGLGASIRVVVHYEGDRGYIVTAFPRRSFP